MESLTYSVAEGHINRSANAARICPDAFGRAIFLAQSSARVRSERFWSVLPALYRGFLSGNRDRAIFGLEAKWNGTVDNYANRASIWSTLYSANDSVERLNVLRSLEWLSAIKGGFVLQLTTGEGGCIDSVNAKRFGLDVRKVSRMSSANYLALTSELGDSVKLWAEWCNIVGETRGVDPVALSLAHVEFVETGEYPPLTFDPRNDV